MTRYATEKLNYYFYEESDDKDGFFTVYFGNNESQFMASFVAEFNNEDDANEYVDWKNNELELREGTLLEDYIEGTDEDDETNDLVDMFTKYQEDRD